MNKREAVLSLLDPNQEPPYVPAAFFLHFGQDYERGQAAIDKHLEYFHYTDMDFVKIQYENPFPRQEAIQKPADWAKMPFFDKDFYEGQLKVVEGLVKAAKGEALVIQTLYSPFMLAGQAATDEMVTEHIKQDHQAVKKGMEVITDSLMVFVKECIRLGVDGFYTSTQGGEFGRFDNSTLFNETIKPYDLAVMREASEHSIFNILHVCDYHLGYAELTHFLDYPGQVVNCNLELQHRTVTPLEVERMFNRPYMGGMQRKGVLATGSPEEVKQAAQEVLKIAPKRFILAADCTVPADTPWDNLKAAIETAHNTTIEG